MEERRSPEYTLEIFADRTCVKDVVKGQYYSNQLLQWTI